MKSDQPYQSDDKITQRLRSKGYTVTEYIIGPKIVLGGVYHTEDAEIAYRYNEEENTVYLIYYERLKERKGLKNPFADMNLFGEICVKAGVAYVKGMVSDLFKGEDGLSRRRLELYYRRRYKAEILEMEGSSRWMRLDMVKYGETIGIKPDM